MGNIVDVKDLVEGSKKYDKPKQSTPPKEETILKFFEVFDSLATATDEDYDNLVDSLKS